MKKMEIYVAPEVKMHELSYEGNLCTSGLTEEVRIIDVDEW